MNTATAPLNAEESRIVYLLCEHVERRTSIGDTYLSHSLSTNDPEVLRRLLYELKQKQDEAPGETLKLIGHKAFNELNEYNYN